MHRVVETCDYNGLTLEVIDGPGFCEEYPHRYSSYLEESIAEYIESAGPVSFFQIFVLVLIYGMPYSEEDQTLLWALYRRLEPNCVRMFIIYTNGDHFRKEEMTSGKTFSQWFTEQGFSPREHYSGAVLFDNKTDDVEILQKQRQRLLHLIFNQIRQTYNKS
ncbi:unnamed protein product [Lymnaea stagnalis]|uniref:AIG1-type G domain-containing protein n=1 Tax=Lymnaea stagnalis TaxID=6523 RepID=A0AAV2IF11_LYMST